ncbi:hypothetical protein RWV98_17565 [Agathobaculum sp. NTUH-O15-33]|uniref:hypothetical protein n=1 Tax=Agathobaculum sp. NTUH-O15-33 TaxID=3079302 RepID=UPI002958DA48|nr:hypothetical protein [Agathobaculum sp. NTUH-O15-33]WNX84360.1 hypothetical protein RWV98_17565 [Agathobaculum sp. NTUH-O15-33]
MELTKASKHVLAQIYKLYKERRSEGMDKDDASSFASSMWGGPKFEDFDYAEEELRKKDYIKSDVTGGFVLTDSAIAMMENLPKETVKEWIDLISKLIP